MVSQNLATEPLGVNRISMVLTSEERLRTLQDAHGLRDAALGHREPARERSRHGNARECNEPSKRIFTRRFETRRTSTRRGGVRVRSIPLQRSRR